MFGSVQLKPSGPLMYSFPPIFAGEFIDSVGYGPILIDQERLNELLYIALEQYSNLNREQRLGLQTLLIRYNNCLNLPYAYERAEGFWRIVESMGNTIEDNQRIVTAYQEVKSFMGLRNNSTTLKKFISVLVELNISYSSEEVQKSFDFRNKSTHEYLNYSVLKYEGLSGVFVFLQKCVEFIILDKLSINKDFHIPANYSLIENRVF